MAHLIYISLLFFSLLSFASEKGVLPISKGRVIAYESQSFEDTDHPTFVFLPGINRGQRADDAFIQVLNQHHISYVYFDFAEQVNSILETDKDSAPDFSNITSKDLAEEMDAVIEHLKIQHAVPVTLSYSGSLTAHIDSHKYPLVIDAVPIGKDTDTLPPQMAAMYETWKAWLKLNPFGEIWLRNAKDMQLRNHWTSFVDGLKEKNPKLKDPVYSQRAVEGYKSLSFASDGFDLREQDFAKGPKRFFILAENEEPVRLEIQKQAIEKYQKQTGHTENVIVLEKSGHVVTADQPEALLQALLKVTAEYDQN